MLAVPTKKSKRADWAIPLRQYIAATYGESTADEQTENLTKLNLSREWVLNNTKKIDEQGLEQVRSYLRMLGTVEARFPVKETDVNITFTWYDSFKPAKKFMHHRVEAERAAVLFNYAAMHSYAGMVHDRSSIEGNQVAVTHFLTAATYFSFLRDTYIPEKVDGPVTSDLSEEGLTMLTNLMLAQTQVCIFEKALRQKMSSGVLSKIASGAKQLYHNAIVAAESPNLAEIIDKSWNDHMTFQMRCLEASASFHYSKVIFKQAEETGEGYGTRIAYLQQAQEYCERILSNKDKLLPGQSETINSLKQTIAKDLGKALADNNQIYMDMVPNPQSLEAPSAHVLAKIDMDKIDPLLVGPILPGADGEDSPAGTELFRSLLPAEVQVAVAMFKSSIASIVDQVSKAVNDSTSNVKDALAGANLPATIEAGGGTRGVPDTTWSKVLENVHQNGGINSLRSTLLGNAKLAEQLEATLYQAQQSLINDETKDMQQRQLYGDRWGLPPAPEANAMVKRELAKYKGFLTEAKESDRLLLQRIDSPELGSVLHDVSLQKAALDNLMPDPGMVDDDEEVESLRSKLRMSYIKLQTHLQRVQSELDGFIYNTTKATIINDLVKKDSTVNELISDEDEIQAIIDIKISLYKEPCDEIKKLAEESTTLLSRVLTDNSNYLSARRENKATKESENVLARLEYGVQKFLELHKHVSEGKKFYANLSDKVEKLRIMVADHCMTRDMLGQEMQQNLDRGMPASPFSSMPMTTANAPPQHQHLAPNTQAPSFFNTQPRAQFQQPPAQFQQPPAQYQQPPAQFQQPPAQFQQPPVQYQPQPTPGVQPTLNMAPTPAPQPSNGLSTYEQLVRAQEEAERQGTLNNFAGTNVNGGAAGGGGVPAGQQSDMEAAQTAMALQQEEILQRIRTEQAMKESRRTDFNKELNEVKTLLGHEYSDKLILQHLKLNQGNVGLTVSNLLDGVTPKAAAKARKKNGGGGGAFGFFTRRNKKKNVAPGVAAPFVPPANNNNNMPGGNVW